MVFDVVMPKMGESITEGTILEWRKNPGDSIQVLAQGNLTHAKVTLDFIDLPVCTGQFNGQVI